MRSTVAIYDSHWTALDAVEVLKNKSYPVSKLSILGQAKVNDPDKKKKSVKQTKQDSISLGIVLGSNVGVLPQSRIMAVPELGFIFGSGAILDAIADYNEDFKGIRMGTILGIIGIKKDKVDKYRRVFHEGKFLVVAQGRDDEVEKANTILCNCGRPLEINLQ